MRIRKSPRDMKSSERVSFTDSVLLLKQDIHNLRDGSTIGHYDQHVAIHLGVTGRFKGGVPMAANDLDGGHGGPGFLPWHREYLLRIENDLLALGADTPAIPYWDWMDHGTTFDIIFKDDFLGQYDNSRPVIVDQTRFATGGQWKLDQRVRMKMIVDLVFDPNAIVPEWGNDLERRFRAPVSLPSLDTDSFLMERPTFDEFRLAVEAGVPGHRRTHNYMHGWVGGVMGSHASPYDPIFLLNHGFIDRLWALWQALGHNGDTHYTSMISPPYGHGIRDPMWPWDGNDNVTTIDRLEAVLPEFDPGDMRTPEDVLDCKKLGYSYVDWSRVKDILDGAVESWSDERGGAIPRLSIIHGGTFNWSTRDELLSASARGKPLIAPEMIGNGKGHQSNLISALRVGFPGEGIRRMPAGGPHIPLIQIAEIAHWIDMGCPDDDGNPV